MLSTVQNTGWKRKAAEVGNERLEKSKKQPNSKNRSAPQAERGAYVRSITGHISNRLAVSFSGTSAMAQLATHGSIAACWTG